MKLLFFAFFFSSCIHFSFSQENSDTLKSNNLKILKDVRIEKIADLYKETYNLKGYRVQIYQGNKRQPANETRASFLRAHPKTKAHLNYIQPLFKVRVGDFKTKLEALKYKNSINNDFPNSFIVKDYINVIK